MYVHRPSRHDGSERVYHNVVITCGLRPMYSSIRIVAHLYELSTNKIVWRISSGMCVRVYLSSSKPFSRQSWQNVAPFIQWMIDGYPGWHSKRKLDENGVANRTIGASPFLMVTLQSFGNFNWYWNEVRMRFLRDVMNRTMPSQSKPNQNVTNKNPLIYFNGNYLSLWQWLFSSIFFSFKLVPVLVPLYSTSFYVIWYEECNVALSISELHYLAPSISISISLFISHDISKPFFVNENMMNCLRLLKFHSTHIHSTLTRHTYHVETMECPKAKPFQWNEGMQRKQCETFAEKPQKSSIASLFIYIQCA